MVEITSSFPAISFEKVSFSYPSSDEVASQTVINDVSFSVSAGAFCLLTGATGAGKTTLLRLIKPELTPAGLCTGQIHVFGKDVRELSVAQSASLIGFVGQAGEARCVCDTVLRELAFGLENLGVPSEEMHRRVAETCYFLGIEKLLHKHCAELSGGEHQLVELASVLVMEPKLLVLDEPTASLDPLARTDFAHALFRLNRELGITILASTHEPWTLAPYATECLGVQEARVSSKTLDEVASEPAMPSVDELLDGVTRIDAQTVRKSPCGGICALEIWLRYERTAPWVLRNLSYEVPSGSVGVIVGGNGSGKSTLLAALAGIRTVSRGRVKHLNTADDKHILRHNKRMQPSALFVPQDPEATFSCALVSEELGAWLPKCENNDYASQLVMLWSERLGIEHLLSRDPFELSRGQRQLVAIGKAFISNPDLLILDEPTSGLDMAGKKRVASGIAERRNNGCTTIIATHDLMFARTLADNISLMFDGNLACSMPPEVFFSRNIFFK